MTGMASAFAIIVREDGEDCYGNAHNGIAGSYGTVSVMPYSPWRKQNPYPEEKIHPVLPMLLLHGVPPFLLTLFCISDLTAPALAKAARVLPLPRLVTDVIVGLDKGNDIVQELLVRPGRGNR